MIFFQSTKSDFFLRRGEEGLDKWVGEVREFF